MNELKLNLAAEEYPERDIRLIVIHCSAMRCNVPFNPDMQEIAHCERGFDGIGYHFYIETVPIYCLVVWSSQKLCLSL